MKRFFQSFKNIWKIEELRGRILTTLSLLLIYRIGSYVALPGIDASQIGANSNGVTDILNMFAGGAFSRASIFALGIMPYITASIIMQLLGIAVPAVQKLQKDGESGRRKITQWTRFLTIAICAVQAPTYIAAYASGGIPADAGVFWWASTIVILVTGTLFVMWLGERITEKGLGNGISLIIMVGIIASLPLSFGQEVSARLQGGGGFYLLIVEVALFLLVIILTVLLVQGVRRIPVHFAKKIVGNTTSQGARQYIPLKVNSAGVMPIIFAQAIMVVPSFLAGKFESPFLANFARFDSIWYNLLLATLIILFTYFYTAITINPNQMADDLKRSGGFVPGIKPGQQTAEYIDKILSLITFPGSLFLAFIAILPFFAITFLGVTPNFAMFFGGTSLLIMVGVVLDTLQQIESYLLNRHYDGLMKTGKIKGRNDIMANSTI